jgi:hypothetical protein
MTDRNDVPSDSADSWLERRIQSGKLLVLPTYYPMNSAVGHRPDKYARALLAELQDCEAHPPRPVLDLQFCGSAAGRIRIHSLARFTRRPESEAHRRLSHPRGRRGRRRARPPKPISCRVAFARMHRSPLTMSALIGLQFPHGDAITRTSAMVDPWGADRRGSHVGLGCRSGSLLSGLSLPR